jgi:hypothetical protein
MGRTAFKTGEETKETGTSVTVTMSEDRLKEWRSMLRSAMRFDRSPMDQIQVETPLGTLLIELREADNRGGAYMQGTLEKDEKTVWVSDPFHRVGRGVNSVIGQDESQIALEITEE